MGLLVLMGSGETAPSMIKPHRQVFDGVPAGRFLVLDSPHGFQMNADDLAQRTTAYFRDSVGRDVETLQWRRTEDPVATARANAAIAQATWVFAGPGSPTYALRVWQDTGISDWLVDVVKRGGAVIFASAAALTTGTYTVPVYEIYKSGADPHWERGLDLVSRLVGASITVIPHFDNAEGGNHDTRYCYLGEERLRLLESQQSTPVLGIDEHTAVIIDTDADELRVDGVGGMTLRFEGVSRVLPGGSSLPLDDLRAWALGKLSSQGLHAHSSGQVGSDSADDGSAGDAGDETGDEAGERGVDAAVDRLITLVAENVVDDDRRVRMQSMVLELGELARAGLADSTRHEALVSLILAERTRARSARDWESADRLRDALVALDITVSDAPA
jgi:cyanophycinase-like exopeptidase